MGSRAHYKNFDGLLGPTVLGEEADVAILVRGASLGLRGSRIPAGPGPSRSSSPAHECRRRGTVPAHTTWPPPFSTHPFTKASAFPLLGGHGLRMSRGGLRIAHDGGNSGGTVPLFRSPRRGLPVCMGSIRRCRKVEFRAPPRAALAHASGYSWDRTAAGKRLRVYRGLNDGRGQRQPMGYPQ